MWLEGRLSQESGLLRGSRDGLDTHRAREDAWPSDSPLENPPPRPPVPKTFLHTLSLRSWESCGKCGPWEIARSSGWQGGLPFPGRCLGTLCKWSDSSRVGQVSRGRRVLGSLSAHARPRCWPKTRQTRLGEKPSPGRLPMFLHSPRRTHLRMEEKGDLRSGGFGPEGSAGLPPRTPGARTPGPGV